ncbi:MAG: hypothetical protein M1829_006727 [Trizodia sp. TS-e1964]|nr:MAG: hypothetical protein M1829_006727 [Trizodia sp. TS-e1964]
MLTRISAAALIHLDGVDPVLEAVLLAIAVLLPVIVGWVPNTAHRQTVSSITDLAATFFKPLLGRARVQSQGLSLETSHTTIYIGGGGIYDCVLNGKIALTFDDGPFIYTTHILDILKSYNVKATFFMAGNNNGKGAIDDPATIYPAIIQRMYQEGHQLASHTWTHENLDTLTSSQRKDQMYRNEMALVNILGVFPTYMRPPYSACSTNGCQNDLGDLGYHITYFDVDTDDYENDSPLLIQNAKNNFDRAITGKPSQNNDFLVIGHDIHQQTAYNLTTYMLDTLLAAGYQAVTVGECLGDPSGNWYRTPSPVPPAPPATPPATSSTPPPQQTSLVTSPDATCGGNDKFTCIGSRFVDLRQSIVEPAAKPHLE